MLAQKTCKKCGEQRPITVFSPHPRMRDGRLNVCSRCRSRRGRELAAMDPSRKARLAAKAAAWRNENREIYLASRAKYYRNNRDRVLRAKRELRLKNSYGLSIDSLERMTAACGGRCQICGDPPSGRWKRLHVDHDHNTGAVRGLLCSGCNRAIGFLNDSPAKALAVASYLEAHGGKKA